MTTQEKLTKCIDDLAKLMTPLRTMLVRRALKPAQLKDTIQTLRKCADSLESLLPLQ